MPFYITDECIECGACPEVCPVNAIVTQRPPIAEPYLSIIAALTVIAQAVKDLHFNGEEISFPLPDGPEITFKFTRRSSSLLAV
jgi:ferredoxin